MWKKRLSDEDATALRADMRAGFGAAKIHGERFPMRRLIELSGLSPPFLSNVFNGKSNSTLPTSNKIRDALRRMLQESPGATESPAQGAEEPADYALPPERKRHSPSRESLALKRERHLAHVAEQNPVRARVKQYCTENGISARTFAIRAGLHESTLSYFLGGKGMKPKNYAKLMRYLERRVGPVATGAQSKPVAPRAALTTRQHQQPLPFANGGADVIAVAARMHGLRQPIPVRTKEEALNHETINALVNKVNKLGIEAIEMLLKIAKSNLDGE